MFEVLDLFIPGREYWDNAKGVFYNTKDTTLHLKHSLISLTRWEQKYKRRFLDQGPNNLEEILYYIKCMTMNREPINDLVYQSISESDYEKVTEYIKDPMSATTLPKPDNDEKGDPLSSELIYYYMTALQIPFECEKWHLNNLLKLINLASIKNEPPDKKKKSKAAIMKNYAAINKARRAKLGTKG